MLPEYSALDTDPAADRVANPDRGAVQCLSDSDGKWMLIAANSDPIFARLARLIGRPELARDPRFIGNRGAGPERRGRSTPSSPHGPGGSREPKWIGW